MTHESLVDDGWPETIELLGGEQVIAESARDTRAFLRPRGIRSASDLLRLTLAYSLGKVGMRAIVAWAVARGIADISDVALLGRLRNTGPWLQIIECPVWLGCRTGQPLKMRLIALRKSDAAANETRRKLNKEAKAKGRQVREETLIAAGFVILVTSLPQDEFSPDAILKLYRMRWRIELAFKRLKSLIGLRAPPAKDPRIVKPWILAHLLIALLTGPLTEAFGVSPS